MNLRRRRSHCKFPLCRGRGEDELIRGLRSGMHFRFACEQFGRGLSVIASVQIYSVNKAIYRATKRKDGQEQKVRRAKELRAAQSATLALACSLPTTTATRSSLRSVRGVALEREQDAHPIPSHCVGGLPQRSNTFKVRAIHGRRKCKMTTRATLVSARAGARATNKQFNKLIKCGFS